MGGTKTDKMTSQQRDLEKEMWTAGSRYSWRKMEVTAQDRAGWRQVVEQQDLSQVGQANHRWGRQHTARLHVHGLWLWSSAHC